MDRIRKILLHHCERIIGMAISFIIILSACETQTNWELETEEIPVIIVDGIITNEIKSHEIKITKPVTDLNAEPEPVSGATVAISDQSVVHYLTENFSNPGVYQTDTTYSAVLGKNYVLFIEYNSKQYYAASGMVPVFLFDTLNYSFNEDTNMYQINWIAPEYSTNAAMYEINIDWRHVPGYDSIPENKKLVKMYDYTLPSIDVSEMFAPDKERIYFPAGTIITEKKYALTDQHAEFLRTLLAETEWRGGYFDVAPGNVATNMSDGALGYFGACTVTSITFIVE